MATNEEGAKNSRQLKGLKWKTQKALDGEGKDPLVGFDEDGNRIVNLGKDASIFSEGSDGSTAEVKGGQFVVTDTSGNETVLSGGSEVVANPTDEATETMTKIAINDVNYNLEANSLKSVNPINYTTITVDDGALNVSAPYGTVPIEIELDEQSYISIELGQSAYIAITGDEHGYIQLDGPNMAFIFLGENDTASYNGAGSHVQFVGSNTYAQFSGSGSQIRLLDLNQVAIGSISGATFTQKATLPATPTNEGTYTLRCVVTSNGTQSFEWVAA